MEDQKKKHVCEECGHRSWSKKDLLQHIRTHTGEKPFSCDICGKKFSGVFNRNRHQFKHAGEKRFQCEVCGLKLTEKGSLTKHMRLHTGDNSFQCSYCDRKFSQSSHLNAHQRIHTKEKLFECQKCGKKFARKVGYNAHIESHEGKSFTCSLCDASLPSFTALKAHRVRVHEKRKKKEECHLCGKAIKSFGLKNHMKRVHDKDKEFSCEVCCRTFNTLRKLERHGILHKEGERYECSLCKNHFIEKLNLYAHMVRLHGGYYNCPHCNIGFASRSDLDKHWMVHPGKPIVCSVCNAVFISEGKLKVHKHRPMLEKLECPFCGKVMFRMKQVLQHIQQVHSELGDDKKDDDKETSVDCSICDRKFSADNERLWHEIVVHRILNLILPADEKKSNIEIPSTFCENSISGNSDLEDSIEFSEHTVFVSEVIGKDKQSTSDKFETFMESNSSTDNENIKFVGGSISMKEELCQDIVKEEVYNKDISETLS